MNYTELVLLIKDFCEYEEADFVTHIPDFVRNAEERICREVYLPFFRKTATSNFVAASRYLSTPTDFLTPYSLNMTNGTTITTLIQKEPDWLREAYATTSTTGPPAYYALHDHNSLAVGPTPDSNYACELVYNHQPASIVTEATTWLGDNARNALLYGSLVEASIFMRQDGDVKADYEQRFQEALNQLDVFGGVRARKDDYRKRDQRKGVDV